MGRAKAPRITASFTPAMADAIREWGKAHGATNDSEALRLLVTWALTQPRDRAVAMAYQKVRAELWATGRLAFERAFEAVSNAVEKRGR